MLKFKLVIYCFIATLISSPSYAVMKVTALYQTQAKQCLELKCVRHEINRINMKIVELLAERTAYVRRAGDFKIKMKNANDVARVQDEIKIIAAQSRIIDLPTEISIPVFQALIKSSIKYEQDYIDHSFRIKTGRANKIIKEAVK